MRGGGWMVERLMTPWILGNSSHRRWSTLSPSSSLLHPTVIEIHFCTKVIFHLPKGYNPGIKSISFQRNKHPCLNSWLCGSPLVYRISSDRGRREDVGGRYRWMDGWTCGRMDGLPRDVWIAQGRKIIKGRNEKQTENPFKKGYGDVHDV